MSEIERLNMIAEWQEQHKQLIEDLDNSKKRIEEFEEKISVLLSCKNCPENKGGYICEKEYENKCLSQKIQFIKELQEENAELKSIAEFQQSSNMSRHFENKKLKEGLVVGSMWNKHLNSQNKALEEERDKYRDMTFEQREQLTKAKELLKQWLQTSKASSCDNINIVTDTEQFLSEVEK